MSSSWTEEGKGQLEHRFIVLATKRVDEIGQSQLFAVRETISPGRKAPTQIRTDRKRVPWRRASVFLKRPW